MIDDAGPSLQPRASWWSASAPAMSRIPRPLGLNVARNTGVEHSSGELVVFVDDDMRASPGWLEALLDAAQRESGGGRVHRADPGSSGGSSRPRTCGREGPPITALELGAERHRRALRLGRQHGDPPQRPGTRGAVRRLARARRRRAGVAGTPARADTRQRGSCTWRARPSSTAAPERTRACGSLARSGLRARPRSSALRRPARGGALVCRASCSRSPAASGTSLRRRCPAGLTMVAHSAGRLREGLRERPGAQRTSQGGDRAEDFLSGTSGTVGGTRLPLRARLQDEAVDAWETGQRPAPAPELAARRDPPPRAGARARRRASRAQRAARRDARRAAALAPRRSSCTPCRPGRRGKFENLNRLLAAHPADGHDWLLLVDDDVELPRGFLDRFLFLVRALLAASSPSPPTA